MGWGYIYLIPLAIEIIAMYNTSEVLKVAAAAIQERYKEEIASYQARRARVMAALESANQGVSPTLGKGGRFHAPFDGYEYGDDGAVYGGGEFLPFMDEYLDPLKPTVWAKINFKTKILIQSNDFAEFKSLVVDYVAEVNCGKSFANAGVNCCYAYLECYTKGMKKIIDDCVQPYEAARKRTVLESKGDAALGKGTLSCTVLSTKAFESRYGYNQLDWKMMVKFENGSTAWGTIPKSILQEVQVGDEIELTASFTGADDKTHAYFKRPSAVITKKSESNN